MYNKNENKLDALKRIKLLMEYDMRKTKNENILQLEQDTTSGNVGSDYFQQLQTQQKTDAELKNKKNEIIVDDSPIAKLQRKYLDLYTKRLSIPNGKKVPEGFSPFNYEEYLSKAEKLSQKCPQIKNRIYEQKASTPQVTQLPYQWSKGATSTPTKDLENKTYTSLTTDDTGVLNCEEEFKKLRSQYYSKKFPNGITQDDKIEFNRKYSEIQSKIKEAEEYYSKNIEGGFGKSFNYKELNPKDKEYYDKLTKEKEDLELFYGYDGRTSFDKFMDSEWGIVAQIGASTALLIAGAFVEGATWPLAAEILLNISIGAYQLNRGNTREALMSFIFAGLTQLHKLYDAVKITAAKRIIDFGKVSKSIVTKLKGVKLGNSAEINAFLQTLTSEERFLFKTVLKQDSKIIIQDLEELAKKTAKLKNIKDPLTWNNAAQKITTGTVKLAKNIVADTSVIMTIQEIYEKFKELCKTKGIDITWGERDHEILEKIQSGLTSVEQRTLFEKLKLVLDNLTKEEGNKLINDTIPKQPVEEVKKIITKKTEEVVNEAKKLYADSLSQIKTNIQKLDVTNRDSLNSEFEKRLNQKFSKTTQNP
jgi:hypothetical protein